MVVGGNTYSVGGMREMGDSIYGYRDKYVRNWGWGVAGGGVGWYWEGNFSAVG